MLFMSFLVFSFWLFPFFPDHFCVWVFFSPVPEARGVRVGNEASRDPLGKVAKNTVIEIVPLRSKGN